jgi:hypothetical protein
MTAGYFAGQTEPVVIRLTVEEYRNLFAEQESVCRHTLPAITKFCTHLLALRKVISE